MEKELKSISCEPECGFMVRSHNEKEVLDMAMKHVKHVHPSMKVSMADLQGRMKTR